MHKKLCSSNGPRWRDAGLALIVSGLLGLSGAVASRAEALPREILPLDEVRAGQTGYGLSVFSGTEPERFNVEILGIWRNLQPGTSFILAELSGQDLETSGVIAGMSGSPVYLEDRLIGAVSFAWPFAQRAVAGITPIEMMRDLMATPDVPVAHAANPPSPDLRDIVAGNLPRDLLVERIAAISAQIPMADRSGLLWTAAGFGPASRKVLSDGLGFVAGAGDTGSVELAELVPGSSVAGVMVDGDLRLAATGTVTDRQGDTIVAFGHPFLGVGPLRVPMAVSEVITVMSSRFSSFKISNLGPVVGAIDLDRLAGIRGRIGLEAPTTPMRVAIQGDREREFRLELADLPTMVPTLMAISVLGALDAVTQAAGPQGIDLEARLDLGESGNLEIHQSFDGDFAAVEAAIYLMAITDYVLNNALQKVLVQDIDIELLQHPAPRLARLVEANASRTVVRPGDGVRINFDLVAFRGRRFRRSLDLQVPTGIPEGKYYLLVGDGVSVDGARLAVEKAAPQNFPQALELLRSLHSRRDLVVLGLFAGPGLSVAGEVLPQLPGSLRSIWSAAPSSNAKPLHLAIAQEHVIRLEQPALGMVRIDLEVRREGPMAEDNDVTSKRKPPE